MNLTDFLKNCPSAVKCERIGFEPTILEHFDACVIEAAGAKKIAVVTDQRYRDYVESKLLKSLALHDVEAAYCLCVRSVESFADQISSAVSGLDADSMIVALGDEALFSAARIAAEKAGVKYAMAIVSELPSRRFFSAEQTAVEVKSLDFDLTAIRSMSASDWRETISGLDLFVNAFLVEAHLAEALGDNRARGVKQAVGEIERVRDASIENDEDVTLVVEGYAWLAVARAALGYDTSLDFVARYDAACPQHLPATAFDHAAVLLHLLNMIVDVESLEIDPDDCAAHQLPQNIFERSLRQTLVEDELGFDWLKAANAAWADRTSTRNMVHTLVSGWDDLCEQLRTRATLIRQILDERGIEDPAELNDVWMHAARFAPRHALVHVMEILRLLEGALFE